MLPVNRCSAIMICNSGVNATSNAEEGKEKFSITFGFPSHNVFIFKRDVHCFNKPEKKLKQ